MSYANFRRTKVVATIGPASDNEETLAELIKAGVNVFRLNFSHGTHEGHRKVIEMIQKCSLEQNWPVGILMDLQGPKIRVGKIIEGGINLIPGNLLIITTEEMLGLGEKVSTTYQSLPDDVKSGDHILLDDGLLELEVDHVENREVHCKVLVGGTLTSKKGINLPNIKLSTPALTEKDEADVLFAKDNDIDYIALSFVRSPADIKVLKDKLDGMNLSIPIIAKIEKPEAIDCIDEIIEVTDGIMVARGDLGVEMPVSDIPRMQKEMVAKCNSVGKPVIIATQMLDSMIQNPRPTRAEATDVANAVLDGGDAVMLSAESAAGKYPVTSVKTMVEIIQKIESWDIAPDLAKKLTATYKIVGTSQGVCYSAVNVARNLKAKLIACVTFSGYAPQQLSRFKSNRPIIAVTKNPVIQRRMTLIGGVTAFLVDAMETLEESLTQIESMADQMDFLKEGDLIVITAGATGVAKFATNMIKVHTVAKQK